MPRSAARTKDRIAVAAGRHFAELGFERTTVRAVAAEAGVDPALVIRYFGGKEGLFAAVADLRLDLPDLAPLTDAERADALVDRFFAVWEDDDTFLLLLRAAATSESAAARLRAVFAEQVAPALAQVTYDEAVARAGLVGSQVIGFAYARYVLAVEPLASMTRADVRRWLGPAILDHLTRRPAG